MLEFNLENSQLACFTITWIFI